MVNGKLDGVLNGSEADDDEEDMDRDIDVRDADVVDVELGMKDALDVADVVGDVLDGNAEETMSAGPG